MSEQFSNERLEIDEKTLIQLIVFKAGDEEFGVKIDAVREIIKMGIITLIPESPDFIKGIINVRGEIVTAIDIKSRFGLITPEKEEKHIVVTRQGDNLFGLIVDEVIEVLRITKKSIQPAPSLMDVINKKYVSGIITQGNRLIILLDLDQILSYHELVNLSHLKKSQKLTKQKHVKDDHAGIDED